MGGFLLGGLVLGAVLVPAYAVRTRRIGPTLESAVIIFISSVAIAAGLKLIVVCATTANIKPFAAEDRVYIIVGGITLIWVSVKTILGFLKLSG